MLIGLSQKVMIVRAAISKLTCPRRERCSSCQSNRLLITMVHEYFKMMRVRTKASILTSMIISERTNLDPPFLGPSIRDIKPSKVLDFLCEIWGKSKDFDFA